MLAQICTAPHANRHASCTASIELSLEDQIRARPSMTEELNAVVVAMNVPLGSLLLVTYAASGRTHCDTYIGRITSRNEGPRGVIFFRMLCLNRGVPGAPEVRTFSLRVGFLAGIQLLDLPQEGGRPS